MKMREERRKRENNGGQKFAAGQTRLLCKHKSPFLDRHLAQGQWPLQMTTKHRFFSTPPPTNPRRRWEYRYSFSTGSNSHLEAVDHVTRMINNYHGGEPVQAGIAGRHRPPRHNQGTL